MDIASARERLAAWKKDPVLFVREELHAEPDIWQLEFLTALATNNRLALLACKGPGKTAALAWAILWFMCTHLHPKCVATSISEDNLSDGLWTELATWMNKSQFIKSQFDWTKTRISMKAAPETWYLSARTWPKTADSNQQANTLAGLHADNLLFVMDEAGGIPDAVMAAAEAGLANADEANGKVAKILIAGNPTHLSGPLYRAATVERHMWWLKEITADPDAADRTPRVSITWANEQIEKYGRDNPWVLINVFGKFPPSSLNSLLGVNEVTEAMKRHLQVDAFNWSQKRLGVDCARFGDDSSVIFPRQGLVAFNPVIMRNAKTNEIASRVAVAKVKWESETEYVDGSGGYGAGVVDFLKAAGYSPFEINFASSPSDPRYANKRAEMWFRMATWVKGGGVLPNIPTLVRELTEPTYTFDRKGKLIIEPKDSIKKRLGFSPDSADALALTFAEVEMPKAFATIMGYGNTVKHESEYDPYSEERLK